jgi:hypothetical protein
MLALSLLLTAYASARRAASVEARRGFELPTFDQGRLRTEDAIVMWRKGVEIDAGVAPSNTSDTDDCP